IGLSNNTNETCFMRHFFKSNLFCKETNYIFAVQFGKRVAQNLPAIGRNDIKIQCGLEQLVARRAHNPKVTGSSPVPATTEKKAFRCKSGSLFFFVATR